MIAEKPFKILAIDGGGIKGLFAAEIISSLEKEFGKPISDYFDMICGTSTGGLIALSLAIGESGRSITDFYTNKGKEIFPNKSKFARTLALIRQLVLHSKYSNQPLKKALYEIYGDKKLKDLNNLVCIPSYNLSLGRPKVFKSPLIIDGTSKWIIDPEISLIDVGLATSAAPTYFPIHQIKTDYYIDGGVWCNNPAICGLIEAIRFFYNKSFQIDGDIIKYTSIKLLSISTVNQPQSWSTKRKKNRSALLWLSGNRLLQPFMEGQSYFTDYLIYTIANSLPDLGITYKRISHQALSPEKLKNIDLDNASESSLNDLSSLGQDKGAYLRSSDRDTIKEFFTELRTFNNM
jgi:uncharacterized protein